MSSPPSVQLFYPQSLDVEAGVLQVSVFCPLGIRIYIYNNKQYKL